MAHALVSLVCFGHNEQKEDLHNRIPMNLAPYNTPPHDRLIAEMEINSTIDTLPPKQ